jgi:hypothetical protein
MVRCMNPARAGPFGGCVPVQMAGAGMSSHDHDRHLDYSLTLFSRSCCWRGRPGCRRCCCARRWYGRPGCRRCCCTRRWYGRPGCRRCCCARRWYVFPNLATHAFTIWFILTLLGAAVPATAVPAAAVPATGVAAGTIPAAGAVGAVPATGKPISLPHQYSSQTLTVTRFHCPR